MNMMNYVEIEFSVPSLTSVYIENVVFNQDIIYWPEPLTLICFELKAFCRKRALDWLLKHQPLMAKLSTKPFSQKPL